MNDRATTPADSKSKPSRGQRWRRRIVLSLLILIVLIIGGTQVVLWSDVPRRIVIAQLQRQLGLKIDVKSLSTGWFGTSILRDVRASLPLADNAIMIMPRLRVKHTSLLPLVFGETMKFYRLEIERPTLVIRQNDMGRWNVTEAAELMLRTSGGGGADAPARRPALPEMIIREGKVEIIDRRNVQSVLAPVSVDGKPDGPLLYRYEARSPQRLALNGEVVPGGLWQHDVTMSMSGIEEVIAPFIDDWTETTQVEARWRGQRTNDGQLRGRLELKSLAAGNVRASGVVNAVIDGPRATLRPQSLLVQTAQPLVPEFLITAGLVTTDAQSIRGEELRISAGGGVAEVNGSFNRAENSAIVQAAWRDVRFPLNIAQSGQLEANYQRPFPGRPRINATLTSSGEIDGAGAWNAQVRVSGQGDSFNDMSWSARFPHAKYRGRREVSLDGLTVQASTRGELLRLSQITLPTQGQVAGEGELNFNSNKWWLWLAGGDLGLRRAPGASLAFNINVGGDFNYVELDKLYISAGDVELSMIGAYNDKEPQPLTLRVWLTHLPEFGNEESSIVRGRLRGELDLRGTLQPINLGLNGSLYARELHLRSRSLGDITAKITGAATSTYVTVETQKLNVLGGNWNVSGHWPSDYPQEAFELEVDVDNLPLSELGDAFGKQFVQGTASGHFEIDIRQPKFSKISARGTFAASDVAADDFEAESVRGRVRLQDGLITIDPIELQQQKGMAVAKAQGDVEQIGKWLLEAEVHDWPLRVGADAAMTVTAAAALTVNVPQREVWGDARLGGVFQRAGNSLGTATIAIVAEGKTLRAQQIDASLLGGSLSGHAIFHIDHPLESSANLQWRNIDAGAIDPWVPQFRDFTGKYSGQLVVAPSRDPRALGPLRVDLSLNAEDGNFRALSLGKIDLLAFANASNNFREFRFVTDTCTAAFADGKANLFARISRSGEQPLWAQAVIEFERLDLDQLVHAAAPEADPMPGRLTGRLTLAGEPRLPTESTLPILFGDATVEVTESDLGNFDPIGFLYDAMSLGAARGGPIGRGRLQARLESGNVEVSNFYLFNRGVEVRGVASVREIFHFPESPIAGTFIGTARPLRDLKLPLMADVDQILSAVQSNATTVEASGTLRDPKVRATTLDDVSEALRVLLVGDVKQQKR